jgi:hypothetical protein
VNHTRFIEKSALLEKSAAGVTGFLTQADILSAIAPQLGARSDTFRIRSYGDYAPAEGREPVRVWCEVIVQRVPEISAGYSDGSRRAFKIVSFRWLAEDDV